MLNIDFDMCLQNCEEDINCRDGYTCVDPADQMAIAFNHDMTLPTQKVCFNEDNFNYFIGLKGYMNAFLDILRH